MTDPILSVEARSMIESLILPEGKSRLSLKKLKEHTYFSKYISSWEDVETGGQKSNLYIEAKDPSNQYDFDEICYESDDPDF